MSKHAQGFWILVAVVIVLGCGDDSKSAPEDAGVEVAECSGQPIEALGGAHRMVISSIEIGSKDDGLDLDGDGAPDNKFATIATLLAPSIEDSMANYDLLLPLELFDFPEPGVDDCVKVAVYTGVYRFDEDGDEHATAGTDGDCDDHDEAVHKSHGEVAGNGIDDNCSGLADETFMQVQGDGGTMTVLVPSADTSDADGDGFTLADGDCNDHNETIAPGKTEVCGDGWDNNCDGVADWTIDGDPAHCSPFDAELDPIALAADSLDQDGLPIRAFRQGQVEASADGLRLRAGPALFPLSLPIADGSALDLTIAEAMIEGDLVMTPAGWILENGRLGGVLRANDADRTYGLEVPAIGLRGQDSLLDGIFSGPLGGLLSLAFAPMSSPGAGCLTPDIDVDGDGLEAFCDRNPEDDTPRVDKCVDGDGTVVLDDGDDCTDAVDDAGKARFVDGVSLVIVFQTTPAQDFNLLN